MDRANRENVTNVTKQYLPKNIIQVAVAIAYIVNPRVVESELSKMKAKSDNHLDKPLITAMPNRSAESLTAEPNLK